MNTKLNKIFDSKIIIDKLNLASIFTIQVFKYNNL